MTTRTIRDHFGPGYGAHIDAASPATLASTYDDATPAELASALEWEAEFFGDSPASKPTAAAARAFAAAPSPATLDAAVIALVAHLRDDVVACAGPRNASIFAPYVARCGHLLGAFGRERARLAQEHPEAFAHDRAADAAAWANAREASGTPADF